MTEALFLLAAFAVGFGVGRWWVVAVGPILAACLVATALLTSWGDSLRETSDGDERGLFAFLVFAGAFVCSAMLALGVAVRSLLTRGDKQNASRGPSRDDRR